jgi:hypothetical protein
MLENVSYTKRIYANDYWIKKDKRKRKGGKCERKWKTN